MSAMVKFWVSGIVMVVLVFGLTAGTGAAVYENFDGYTAGTVIPAGNGWVGWGGPAAANGIVSSPPSNTAAPDKLKRQGRACR